MTNIKTREGQVILSLKNDFLFKVVYGSDTEESKTVLMALLNLILRREEDPIVDIHYKNPFQYRQYFDEKETVLDIKVTTSSGDIIDIEMQMIWQSDLKERFITYHGGLIRESLSKGEPYGRMKTTITIGIVDAVFLDGDDFISEFYFISRKTGSLLSDRSYICCIELPKVNREKKSIEELTPLELCLEYLKHADENGSEYVDTLIRKGGKELKMAQEMFRKATEDEILREQAIAREKFENDMITMNYYMDQARQIMENKDQILEETERARGEKDRIMNETERLTQEKDRIVNETERLTQEKDRIVNETERLTQEKDRIMNETERLTQEKDRIVNETDQLTQEKQQLEKEIKQLRKETERLR